MSRKHKILTGVLLSIAIVLLSVSFLYDKNLQILNPAGSIASQQRDLIVVATALMLVIVIPIFVMTGLFVWKYREGNPKKSKYTPEWDGNRLLESIWWGLPIFIILILSVITWKSTHELDPFKPIDASTKPIKVQVIALDWKWLFIYPEHNVASINYVQFPEDTPVDFEITADAPMNSFWIPQLGGQIYAMSGMSTHLHLIADQPGTYKGSSANLSGEGFAGMKFEAQSTSTQDFNKWVEDTRSSSRVLTASEYKKVAEPSKNNPVATFATGNTDIYDSVMLKYLGSHGSAHSSGGHN